MTKAPFEAIERLFSEEARFQRWLDVEAALAEAQARLGVIPTEAAEEIRGKADVHLLDLGRYAEHYERTGHPIVALLRLWQTILSAEAGQFVHLGATTQDIIDTGTMLGLRETHEVALASLLRIEAGLLALAEEHADTLMVGRTHGAQALPITFGFKVAVWAREIRRCIERLRQCVERVYVIQLSGAVGTMAAFGEYGPELQRLVAERLGLGVPDISWHASRDRLVEFSGLLTFIAGAVGRIGQEVFLLMATEVGEVREPWQEGLVGSSTMPHKVNPEKSQHVMSLARRVRYNSAYLTEVMLVHNERDLEHFLGEREKLEESCRLVGELLSYGEDFAMDLTVYPERMRKNLDLLGGLLMSEAVMLELGKSIGKQSAHEVVYEDAMKAIETGVSFKQALFGDPAVAEHLQEADLDRLLDPRNWVGNAPQITREAVALSRRQREKD